MPLYLGMQWFIIPLYICLTFFLVTFLKALSVNSLSLQETGTTKIKLKMLQMILMMFVWLCLIYGLKWDWLYTHFVVPSDNEMPEPSNSEVQKELNNKHFYTFSTFTNT